MIISHIDPVTKEDLNWTAPGMNPMHPAEYEVRRCHTIGESLLLSVCQFHIAFWLLSLMLVVILPE